MPSASLTLAYSLSISMVCFDQAIHVYIRIHVYVYIHVYPGKLMLSRQYTDSVLARYVGELRRSSEAAAPMPLASITALTPHVFPPYVPLRVRKVALMHPPVPAYDPSSMFQQCCAALRSASIRRDGGSVAVLCVHAQGPMDAGYDDAFSDSTFWRLPPRLVDV